MTVHYQGMPGKLIFEAHRTYSRCNRRSQLDDDGHRSKFAKHSYIEAPHSMLHCVHIIAHQFKCTINSNTYVCLQKCMHYVHSGATVSHCCLIAVTVLHKKYLQLVKMNKSLLHHIGSKNIICCVTLGVRM